MCLQSRCMFVFIQKRIHIFHRWSLHRGPLASFPTGAGLLTMLHSEVPSRPSGQWLIASEPYGSSQLRDSRRFSLHSQLIAVKQTLAGRNYRSTGAKVRTNPETSKLLGHKKYTERSKERPVLQKNKRESVYFVILSYNLTY